MLNSLPSACTHSQNAPVELWRSYQTNFTRAKALNHSDFFGRLSIRPSFGVREEEICRRQRWGPGGRGGGEVAKGERMHFFYYSPFPKKHILRLLFWDIFAGTTLKLKQDYRLTFSSFNNCPSYAIGCHRWHETVTVLKPKYSLERQNWGIIFRIQLMQQQVIDKFWKKMCVGHVANPFEVS